MKKIYSAPAGIALGVLVMLLPLEGLDFAARAALGILSWAIVWWVFKVLPDFVTAMIMGVMFVIVCGVPTKVAFNAFSESSWWLLMSAFGLGLGVSRSGLMQRLSLYILKIFPETFSGQVLGLLTVGTVTGPFIPSMSAKTAILAPLSMGISDSMGYERKGKQANGLFLAMLSGVRNPGPLFISASVLGYAFLGQYPAEYSARYTMGYWFLAALPWFLFVSIVNYIVLVRLYRPKAETKASKAELNARIEALGPMSKKEKRMLAIMLMTMLLWISEPLHGVPAYAVAIAAVCATIGFGILSAQEFNSNMNWTSIIFIGVVLGIATAFDYLGINTWIVNACSPAFSFFAGNPYRLVLCTGVAVVLLRFVIVSELALVNIIMVFLVPITIQQGISPWIIGFVVYALISPWFFLYQNPVYMAAYYAVKGEMAEHKTVAFYCFIYILICLAGLVISVPYWQLAGIYSI